MNYSVHASRPLYISRGSTDQIYSIFTQHGYELSNIRRRIEQEIDDWRIDFIQRIDNHVTAQKQLVHKAYENQWKSLCNMREHFVASCIYEVKDDITETRRLLDKCRNLSLNLANLEYPSRENLYIDVIPIEPKEEIYHEQVDVNRNKSNELGSKTMPMDVTSELLTPYSKESNLSSNAQATTTFNRTYDASTGGTKLYSAEDKCPLCFMIFPPYMSDSERQLHAQEHV
ncbi:hypothetical protein I4U23_024110 [Adineta vaga]|nr:hypothetical protein I4U23_024110 [Adineta vaga]